MSTASVTAVQGGVPECYCARGVTSSLVWPGRERPLRVFNAGTPTFDPILMRSRREYLQTHLRHTTKERPMDSMYLGVGFLFFVLSWGFVRLSERL
jgi:hypothetical protein